MSKEPVEEIAEKEALLNLHHGLKGGISRVGKLKMPNRGKTDNAMWNGGTKEIGDRCASSGPVE